MIRRNNPSIDYDELEASVRSRAETLRARPQIPPDSAFEHYRAANAYIDRAEELVQPRARIPNRLAFLGDWAGRLLLRTYNLALRPLREASVAQNEALRELLEAGLSIAKRLEELERKNNS
jgi:hypothetical protein